MRNRKPADDRRPDNCKIQRATRNEAVSITEVSGWW